MEREFIKGWELQVLPAVTQDYNSRTHRGERPAPDELHAKVVLVKFDSGVDVSHLAYDVQILPGVFSQPGCCTSLQTDWAERQWDRWVKNGVCEATRRLI